MLALYLLLMDWVWTSSAALSHKSTPTFPKSFNVTLTLTKFLLPREKQFTANLLERKDVYFTRVSVQNTKAGQAVVVKNRNYAEKSPQLGTHVSVLPMEEIVDISEKFLQAKNFHGPFCFASVAIM
jgi:hypothetical protein